MCHGSHKLLELNGMSDGVFDSSFEMSAKTTVVDTGCEFLPCLAMEFANR